ncbi:MAG: DUF367 family protein [Promethearchaeota archaeon]|jgi:pre-rRNA-processing protein TSR3
MKESNSINFTPKLYCLHYDECDPKKCTAIKLRNLQLLKVKKKLEGRLKNSLILNPFARKTLTVNDRETVLKNGLTVIDCSWKNLLKLSGMESKLERKLPSLIAANPTNYGKWEKLSSVEALAGALYITEFPKLADLILSKFSWGIEFKSLNKFEKKLEKE